MRKGKRTCVTHMSLTGGPTTWTHTTRQHHQRTKKTRQQGLNGLLILGLSTHPGTLCMRSRRLGRAKTRGPRYQPRNSDSQKHNPDRLIFFTTAAVPGRSAALDVCAASPNAAAARGDAAQAAFDRKISQYKQQIPDLRGQGILYRPLVWTAEKRPHPAATRTLQHAADIASSRNGQQLSAISSALMGT